MVHSGSGNVRALSHTLYRLYYMYCLRHFRPTRLLREEPSAKLSAFETGPEECPASVNKSTCRNTVRTDGNESIAPPPRGGPCGLPQVLHLNFVCAFFPSAWHGTCPEAVSPGHGAVCIHISVHQTEAGWYLVASQAA